MKNKFRLIIGSLAFFALSGLAFTCLPHMRIDGPYMRIDGPSHLRSQGPPQVRGDDPWKPGQLLQPADLAKTITDPQAKKPYIFCIGPGAVIKGSIDIGPARDSSNLNNLRLQLGRLPRDADVVIYCGCCPFVHCPNIRPAFALLNELQFTHARLLNLEHNVRVDWIGKGYPGAK